MQTFENKDREILEIEILKTIVSRPDLLDSEELSGKYFSNAYTRKVFAAIVELKLEGREISFISLLEKVEIETAKFFTDTDFTIWHLPKEFSESCERLREDWTRTQLMRELETAKTSNEYLQFISTLSQNGMFDFPTISEHLQQYEKNYIKTQKAIEEGKNVGITFGWSKFEKDITIRHGDIVIVGAGTSIGKTTFALNMAIEAAGNFQKVLYISMEMEREEIFDKTFARLTSMDSKEYTLAKVKLDHAKREFEAIQNNFNFLFAPSCTTQTVRKAIRKSGKVDLVIIDYLQLLSDPMMRGEVRATQVGRMTAELKRMAGEFHCAIVLPCQLNRVGQQQTRPNINNLRESGSIENDANIVLLLHRGEERASEAMEVIVEKNRLGKAHFSLWFNLNPRTSYVKETYEPKKTEQNQFTL